MTDLRARIWALVLVGCGFAGGAPAEGAQPSAAATNTFERYVSGVEARLNGQHRSTENFLVGGSRPLGLRPGAAAIVRVDVPEGFDLDGARIHHWRATAFAPGASASDFEALMRDLPAYPRRFAPEVVRASLVSQSGDTMHTSMRVREQHVLTVWMDLSYDVRFGRLDDGHRFSVSRSTRVRELGGAGTSQERVLSLSEEHGWLWRMNTYWSYEEGDGGLYLQVESVSLTGAVPRGLGWAITPYVETIPRESLDFTMRAVCRAIQKQGEDKR